MTPIETVPTWVLAYAGVFVLFHLIVGYYVYRRSEQQGLPGRARSTLSADNAIDADGGRADLEGHPTVESVVQCDHCNAVNDPGYRYCQHCVQELPRRTGQSLPTEGSDDRESL